MAKKTLINYSSNFYPVKRNKKKIKFLIFHYTGMKKESAAIKKLTKISNYDQKCVSVATGTSLYEGVNTSDIIR